jgi:sortase A
MQDDNDARAHSRSATVLGWSERLFVIAGSAMLGWCAWLSADSVLSQWEARRSLEAVSLAASVGRPHVPGALPSPQPRAIVHRGSVVGELSIPRVALDAVVLHGSDTQTLRRGPGHLENTAFPGKVGNVVIAGHRDSFFRRLGDVVVGDDIFIDTTDGHLHYRVMSTLVVNAHDLSVLKQTDDAILTLITCYPFWVLGPAPDRFIVRAVLVANTSFAALTVPAPASREPLVAQRTSAIDASEESVANAPVAHDDTTLVRQAIGRFRVTYNARLVSHHDVRPGGLLEFHSCDVALADNRAIAWCETGSPSGPGDGERSTWTIGLERADQGWAIKTIVSD